MIFLTPNDLAPFAEIDEPKAEAMIADAEALAVAVAPCLVSDDPALTDAQTAAVKAVLRGAVLRWNDSGSGALQSQSTGPFSVTYDDRNQRRSLFWPSEIESLQSVCSGGDSGAFNVDTVSTTGTVWHSDICSLNFGATYCSCGAVLSGAGPIFGEL